MDSVVIAIQPLFVFCLISVTQKHQLLCRISLSSSLPHCLSFSLPLPLLLAESDDSVLSIVFLPLGTYFVVEIMSHLPCHKTGKLSQGGLNMKVSTYHYALFTACIVSGQTVRPWEVTQRIPGEKEAGSHVRKWVCDTPRTLASVSTCI